MLTRWIAVIGFAAMLAACSSAPVQPREPQVWNGGVWNSVLGYVGPASAMVIGAP